MPNLYTLETSNLSSTAGYSPGERVSILYHDLFDFPMSFSDLIKWAPHRSLCESADRDVSIASKHGYFYLDGREGIVYKRLLRKRASEKKIKIAKRASRVLSFLPTVQMVAVTGSLAMLNASEESDIDLMIITKKDVLWTTRIFAYLALKIMNFKLRKPGDKNQKNKLCLNIWLAEDSLIWGTRNIYSAHEAAQIIPLVNKEKTYEKFLFKNRWILDYWPNAVRIRSWETKNRSAASVGKLAKAIEKQAFSLQYQHMKPKITREVVTSNKALFHPHDWGRVIQERLSS